MRLLPLAVCALAVLAAPRFLLAQAPQQYIITATFYELRGEQPPAKILAEPKVMATVGRKFSYLSGGEIPPDPKFGGEGLEFGTRMDGIIRTNTDGQAQMLLIFQLTENVSGKETDAEVVAGRICKVRLNLSQAQEKEVKLAPNCTLKLRVEPVGD
ncbi:hypothetical protein [Blastopirellula marina]|uniref:Uncharacterized protein n=1 Tax=Blastopirellula marina DSM 3645 TaxID=314230 RepID=A3ZQB1_9BACT|nr:hypothetical protein [Blastopirellula marina]EAQ81387.1 hypothetical protein DSM3645_23386 [Blastopirellula marina DSM 3645]